MPLPSEAGKGIASIRMGMSITKERDRLIREEAMQQGEKRMAKLVLELTQNQRFSDLERATLDEEYRKKLFKDFDI